MERLLQHFEGVSILTLPCDSGTWGVGLVTSARDKELRALRAVPAWEAALALFPNVAHWGAAEPITGVQVIAGLYAAAACDPDVLRAYTSVAAMTALPIDALAEPGMLDKVISLGSTAPRYSAPGPPRAELLDALAPFT